MGARLLLTAWTLAAVWPTAPNLHPPPQTIGQCTAWLEIYIASATEEKGMAEVKLVVTVEGPKSLEVRGVRVEDAVAGWKESRSAPIGGDGTGRWSETIELTQIKPGRVPQVPLPEVAVTFRAKPEDDWHTFAWHDLLRRVVVTPKPVEIPETPSLFQRWRDGLRWTAAAVALAGAIFWMIHRQRRRRPQPLDPVQQVTQELDTAAALTATDPVAACAQMADAVRRFLSERCQLPGTCHTTAEFIEALHPPSATPEQREIVQAFFERCDLVKFAGLRPDAEECRRLVEQARRIVALSTGPVNPTAAVPTPSR